MKNVGVVLAGCGYLDGAEIYESTLTLLFLDRANVPYQCLAPDMPQMHVVNHVTGKETGERRDVLIEASRIARGKIEPLSDDWIPKLDAVIFPGGFGAAKNFTDYPVKGDQCTIQPQIESFMRKILAANKPIGLLCIAPLVLARALKGTNIHPQITVGAESGAARSVEVFGSRHVVCPVTEVVVDRELKIVTTPAYMYDARIADVAQGIEKLVRAVLSLIAA